MFIWMTCEGPKNCRQGRGKVKQALVWEKEDICNGAVIDFSGPHPKTTSSTQNYGILSLELLLV